MTWILKQKDATTLRTKKASDVASFLCSSRNETEIYKESSKGLKRMGSWFPFRENPVDVQYYNVMQSLPLGDLALIGFIDGSRPRKNPKYMRNEIENALREGDLTASEIEEAMTKINNIDSLYEYLEREGEHKSVMLIKRLLA